MLTRKMLKAMGIEEDVIEQIIEAHTETVDALKEQRDGYKADADKAKGLGSELEKVQKQLKEALEDDSQDELRKQNDEQAKEIEKLRKANESLQSEFDTYKSDVETKDMQRRKSDAYKELLEKAGIAPKYAGKVLKVTSLDNIELEDDGSIKDSDKAMEGIKSEWSEFIAQKETKGANPENPPTQGKTVQGVSDRAKRIIAEHYEKKYGKSEE